MVLLFEDCFILAVSEACQIPATPHPVKNEKNSFFNDDLDNDADMQIFNAHHKIMGAPVDRNFCELIQIEQSEYELLLMVKNGLGYHDFP